MSWVIVEKATGDAVIEIFEEKLLAVVNTKKYEAVPIGKYLAELNKKVQSFAPGEPVTSRYVVQP